MRALITGGSSGIGKEIAKILYKKGYEIILVSKDEKKLKQTAKNIGNNIKIIALDLSIEQNCKKIYDKVKDVDILINNAGFGDYGEFTKTDLNKEIKMINTNIIAYHILTKLYLQDMQEKNSGKILNVASIAGFMPGPLMATYYSTKSYIVTLSESIREELRRKKSKVKISILCPGPVDTNFNNVANVEFGIKGLSSKYVAQYTIKKLEKNKFYIVPGTKIKLAKIGAKITPSNIVSRISYKMQKRKNK